MGFTPAQVDDMSLWEFWSCSEGYRKAHSVEDKPPPPTDEEFDQMVATYHQMTRH